MKGFDLPRICALVKIAKRHLRLLGVIVMFISVGCHPTIFIIHHSTKMSRFYYGNFKTSPNVDHPARVIARSNDLDRVTPLALFELIDTIPEPDIAHKARPVLALDLAKFCKFQPSNNHRSLSEIRATIVSP